MFSKKYEGMNAYEIVDLIVNKEMRNYVTDNDINWFIPDGQVVLAILKQKYGAHYVEPEDLHFCGTYCFENPNWIKKPFFEIYTHKFSDTCLEFRYEVTTKSFEDCITKIISFEGCNKMPEEIQEMLEKNYNHYIGDSCIYMVKEKIHSVPPTEK